MHCSVFSFGRTSDLFIWSWSVLPIQRLKQPINLVTGRGTFETDWEFQGAFPMCIGPQCQEHGMEISGPWQSTHHPFPTLLTSNIFYLITVWKGTTCGLQPGILARRTVLDAVSSIWSSFVLQVFFCPQCIRSGRARGLWRNLRALKQRRSGGGTVGMHPDAQAHVKFGTLLPCFLSSCSLFPAEMITHWTTTYINTISDYICTAACSALVEPASWSVLPIQRLKQPINLVTSRGSSETDCEAQGTFPMCMGP